MRRIYILIVSLVAVAFGLRAADSEVTVRNREAGISLAGTLTLPEGGKPKALLVFASGSGSQNRDEELLGHKPFKTIADYLASRGYASLRMDDRGVGGSQGDPSSATTLDYVSDIAAALEYADSVCGGIPLGVLGHSEGGLVAVKNAVENPRCDFIVTIGCPAWKGDSIIMSQARALTTAMTGRWDAEPLQRKILDIAGSDMPNTQARISLYMTVAESVGSDMAKLPAVQQQINAQVDMLVSPWYRTFLRLDPADDIKSVTKPWLALNGDKDFQVLPANLTTIKELNSKADTRLLPDHNHLLQRCHTGYPQEYQGIAEDISPEALAAIADWLDRR